MLIRNNMKQEKETSFIKNLTIMVVCYLIIGLGVGGGLRYLFLPRPTLDSSMVDFCKEWGGKLGAMKFGDSTKFGCSINGEEKECFVWSCIKEDLPIISNTGSDTVFVDEVRGTGPLKNVTSSKK